MIPQANQFISASLHNPYSVLELQKHLLGDGTTFQADFRRGGHFSGKGMVYAKMFYGGMVLFSGGMASPLKSSTVLITRQSKLSSHSNSYS